MKNLKNSAIIMFSIASLPLLSSCSAPEAKQSAQPKISQTTIAQPAPTAAVKPAPALVQPTGEWINWPITAGDWVYRQDDRGSIALFGRAGQDALLTVRCMANSKEIFISRAGSPDNGSQFTIRTSHKLKSYPAANNGASPIYAVASLNANDDMLDALAYTRGRFAIEVDGLLSIAVPSWSEIVRVVQDCR